MRPRRLDRRRAREERPAVRADHQHAGQGQGRSRMAGASYARPISARNLGNQVEDEVVDALIQAVKAAYPRLSHRYYALKARWMGLEKLQYWDRNAPLPEDSDKRRPWADAKVVVLDAYRTFSPTLADIVSRFFEGNWIDAQLRPGQGQRRLLPPDRAQRAPLCPDELPGPRPGHHDPGPRAGARRASGPGRAAGTADVIDAADPGRDRLGVRRAAHLPCPPRRGDRSRPAAACCSRPRSRTC